MQKGLPFNWRQIGHFEKAFIAFILLYIVMYVAGAGWLAQASVGLIGFILGLISLVRLARSAMRNAIWRLRNRLIAAYLFIAVVPVVLIITMVALTANAVIGQMAVYLVNTELNHREANLLRPAEVQARVPAETPERALSRFAAQLRNAFPAFELLISGSVDVRYPANSNLTAPPPAWNRASGLIVRHDGAEKRLYAWAHAEQNREEVTVLAPITHGLLANLLPGIGDVNIVPLLGHLEESHIPPARNSLDFPIRGYYPFSVATWESPEAQEDVLLVVDTRISAVLGMVFQKLDWAEKVLGIFIFVAVLFLLVEIMSLVAGIKLTRTITGAVHEIYEGTEHVKEGDFSYRIPVKGNDQLAELGASFNTMTENLGRLLIVAKEKERLESELEIAREVQNQLFPKDVPFSKSLELKGVCNPARMVSGDYYDFMAISDQVLAFAIGDVAGKGISAALLMATIQSTMRTQLSATNGAGPSHFSTAKLVSNLNRQLYANTAAEKYATFFFAIYNDAAQQLTYTNAGHLAPMLLRGGDIELLDSTGTVVGAFPVVRYTEKTVQLGTGDLLVAYTDGIVEPENAYGEMFGEDRLKDLVVKYGKADSGEIIARTMEAVNQWTGAGELQDDMTMVVAHRL
jgi:sigma-B regulation protein RsbU (phosphoserine phosphatase)